MPKIIFNPMRKTVKAETGSGLLEIAQESGQVISSPCGGKGACGKCRVKIVKGIVDSDSLGLLEKHEVAEGYVLACKTKITDTSLTVEIPELAEIQTGKFVEDFQPELPDCPELLAGQEQPLVIKCFLKIESSISGQGKSDLDRLIKSLQQRLDKKKVICSLKTIQKIPDAIRRENGQVTTLVCQQPEYYQVIDIEAGDSSQELYGLAIDIGTTTVAVRLVDLKKVKILATSYDYNDQINSGQDIISRINYARKKGNLRLLRHQILKTINRLIYDVASIQQISAQDIHNASIAGNTTMIHLLLGINPEYIRLEPYTPTLLEVPYLMAEEIGIDIFPQSGVYISPAVGSYVGGDITSGLLCTDISANKDDISLFIDIGTNGELVMGNKEFLITCACSAGPAFEGGGLDCGMRAARGAIDKIDIDAETGQARYRTIGDVPAIGICGSGMISLLAGLFLTGWIDHAGKLNRHRPCQSIIVEGRMAKYVLARADQKIGTKEVVVSETEIENIIRAKAAIYSACALMLKQVGLNFKDISKIYLAGGFGRFLDIKSAIAIGLIPDLPKEKFFYLGNSALMGAYLTLVSDKFKQQQIALASRLTYIELNTDPAYMEQYTGALFLPHTDINLFPSLKSLLKS